MFATIITINIMIIKAAYVYFNPGRGVLDDELLADPVTVAASMLFVVINAVVFTLIWEKFIASRVTFASIAMGKVNRIQGSSSSAKVLRPSCNLRTVVIGLGPPCCWVG